MARLNFPEGMIPEGYEDESGFHFGPEPKHANRRDRTNRR